MNLLQQFVKASRMNVMPVILMPILLGAAAAYVWYDAFSWTYLFVSLLGGAAVHLFSNMINDYWDFRNGVDKEASQTEGVIMTNSSFLVKGIWSISAFSLVTWSLFAIALACGIYLAFAIGLPVFIYVASGAFLAYFYVAPPLKLGYRGKGYSELAIFLAFGVLPVTGSLYVHAGTLDVRAFLLSCPIGLMTTLILFNHHFLHWQSDQTAGKRTLVVVLGEQKALRFSKLLFLLTLVSLMICIGFGALPWYTLLALIACWPLMKAYRSLGEKRQAEHYLKLMIASSQGSTYFGLLLVVLLIVQSLLL